MLKPLILSLVLIPTPLVAETEEKHVCEQMGELAASIMQFRQDGVPMSTLINEISTGDLVRAMIIDAYNQPRYNTEEYKRMASVDFRNEMEVLCYEQMS